VADTQGEAGKAKIQKEIVSRIDRQLGGKNRARRLFFVEFMVQ
jgi:flagellar basal body-associated protein FliL